MVATDTNAPIVAKNGALIDPVTRRFVKGGKPVTAIADTSQALDMVRRKMERKQAAIAEAANLVARRALKESRQAEVRALADGDAAYLQAIAIGRAQAAMDSDSPYGNGAADWIIEHTGHKEPKQAQEPQVVQHVHSMEPHVLALLEQVRAAQSVELTNIISNDDMLEAEVLDADTADAGTRAREKESEQR